MPGFAHLHVASGFSMRYGASMPEDLVERAAEHGQGAAAGGRGRQGPGKIVESVAVHRWICLLTLR